MRDVLHKLIECAAFDLLELEVAQWIQRKVKDDAALAQLLHEQFLSLVRSCVCREGREGSTGTCFACYNTPHTPLSAGSF